MRPIIADAVRRALASCSTTVPFSPDRIRELPPTAMSIVFNARSQSTRLRFSTLVSSVTQFVQWQYRLRHLAVLHEFQKNRFLRVQPVLRLLVNHRVW